MSDHYIDRHHAARTLGGNRSGPKSILCPGPGRANKRDRSLSVSFDPSYPEGFAVHSFSGDDFRTCRDHVRAALGLPAWKPNGAKTQDQPVFVTSEYIYTDANGDEHHRVEHLSDETFRHSWFEIDDWTRGAPDLILPYALPDVLTDETIWLVRGEYNAQLLRDGFGVIATTYPSGLDVHADPSFLTHFEGRDVRILDVGGARSRVFTRTFADALSLPIHRLPDGYDTLRDYARDPDASADGFTVRDTPDQSEPGSVTATPFQWIDPTSITPRAWLYGDHLIRRFVSVTVSPGGIGKSSLVLAESLAMTSGRPILTDDRVRTPDPLRVWYWNGEDPQDETQRRVIAAALHHGITPADFADRLFTDTGREQTITLGQIMRGEITLDESLFESLEAELIRRRIDVFILDPFVSSHRMGENDNNAIDAVIKRLGKLAERANCAVEIVHHVRKPSGGSTAQTDVNDARGASALIGGVRSARVLNVMSEEIAKEIDGLAIEDRFSFFSVTNGKANMTKRTGDGKWRKLVSVDLQNGPVGLSDNVGVVTHYKLPERAAALDALPDNAVLTAQRAAYDHPNESRLDIQSPDWFGHIIGRLMGINSVDSVGKNTLKIAIQAWIRSGALNVEIRPDAQRKPREYLACPPSEIPLPHTQEPTDDLPF